MRSVDAIVNLNSMRVAGSPLMQVARIVIQQDVCWTNTGFNIRCFGFSTRAKNPVLRRDSNIEGVKPFVFLSFGRFAFRENCA